jgi:hypothetical protein
MRAIEDAAIAQQPVHARQVVVRNRHQQVMLGVEVHPVRGDQQALHQLATVVRVFEIDVRIRREACSAMARIRWRGCGS